MPCVRKAVLIRALAAAAIVQLAIAAGTAWLEARRFPRLHFRARLEGVLPSHHFPTGLVYFDDGKGLNPAQRVAVPYRSLVEAREYTLEIPTHETLRSIVFLPVIFPARVHLSDFSLQQVGHVPLQTGFREVSPDVELVAGKSPGEFTAITTGTEPAVLLFGEAVTTPSMSVAGLLRVMRETLGWLPFALAAGAAFACGSLRGLARLTRRNHLLAGTTLAVLLTATGTAVFWRFEYLRSSSALELPGPVLAAELADALWKDGLLALALLAFLFAGRQIQTTRPKTRFAGIASMAVVVAAAAWTALARLADFGHFHYSGRHLGRMFLSHAQGSALGLRPGAEVGRVLLIGAAGAALTVAALLAWRRALSRSPATREQQAALILGVATLPLVALVTFAAVPLRPVGTLSEARLADAGEATGFPELRIPLLLLRASPEEETTPLPLELAEKLRDYGLAIDPQSRYPLRRARAFEGEVPPLKPGATQRPNVLLIFLESFSADLTSVYENPRYPQVTPRLAEFADESTRIHDTWNATLPTLNGMLSTLCSYMWPVSAQTTYAQGAQNTHVQCLPQMLGRHGWHTVHQMQVEQSYMHMGPILKDTGFEGVYDAHRMLAVLKEPPLSWGYSDHQSFRYVRSLLESEALQEPFFLSFGTVDTHPPFRRTADSLRYGDGSQEILNAVKTTDHAFGEFWSWFRTSRFAKDTVVVVMADHPMLPGQHLQQLLGVEGRGVAYDRILMLLRDPRRNLPKDLEPGLGSSVDVPPTLLHLLDINEPVSWEGRSFFDPDSRTRGLVGVMEDYFFILNKQGSEWVADDFRPEDLACDGPPPATADSAGRAALGRCEYMQWYRWKRALHFSDRIVP